MSESSPWRVAALIRSRFAVLLTLAFGICMGAAVLGTAEAVQQGAPGCIDPSLCEPELPPDFLPTWTAEIRLPWQVQADGFAVLMGMCAGLTLVLLGVLAVNLSTHLLTRAAARRTEFALRVTLGAPPAGLARGLVREAALLTAAASLLGTALGLAGGLLLRATWPLGAAPWEATGGVRPTPMLTAAILILLVVACLTWPLRVAWTTDLRRFLAIGTRATSGPAETLVRDTLAIVQVAAAVVLIVSAGLLVSAFGLPDRDDAAADGDVGGTMLVSRIGLHPVGPGMEELRSRQYEELLRRIRAIPGVVDTSLASEGAWAGLGITERATALCLECWIGLLPKVQTSGPAKIHSVSPDFFAGIGIRARRGRLFGEEDRQKGPPVAVVSHAFALHFFPNGDPVGKEVRIGGLDRDWYRVVGVVDDVRTEGLGSGAYPEPALYLSILQHPPSVATLLVRTKEEIAEVEPLVVSAVASAPRISMGAILTLESLRRRLRAPLQWFAVLFAVLAAAVVAFGSAGLYGLVSYGVGRRRREIAIRMAVGAERRAVLTMILRECLRLVAIGIVIGIIPLSGLARMLQLRFAGVDPWNPFVAVGTIGLLLAVAMVAGYRPGRSASAVNPQVALRGD